MLKTLLAKCFHIYVPAYIKKREMQNIFFMRVARSNPAFKKLYGLVWESGGQTQRPHSHLTHEDPRLLKISLTDRTNITCLSNLSRTGWSSIHLYRQVKTTLNSTYRKQDIWVEFHYMYYRLPNKQVRIRRGAQDR